MTTWISDLEALTNVTDHLQYTHRLISRGDAKSETREQLVNGLQMVRERMEDEDLYIAVVGGASTGKSTFINALLGDALLEPGVLHMTTAAATFVRYGRELTVAIRFHDTGTIQVGEPGGNGTLTTPGAEILLEDIEPGRTRIWRLTPVDQPITESTLPGVDNLSLRELIRHLTTSHEIAGTIVSIVITHPSEFLKPGLVIIDTPGADAQNQAHKEVTRRAVARADAAIITTPADQSVNRWLMQVMEEPDFLQRFMHRSVFLVTRMDLVRERMRRSGRDDAITLIYQDAVQRLKLGLKKFHLPQAPRVYVSSAQAVVDGFSGEEPGVTDPEERAYWQREFAAFQKELFGYLVHQRAVTIAESVLRLLDNLFESIEAHLSELWVDYDDRRSRLKNIISDLDIFGKEQKRLCRNQIEKATRNAVREVELAIDQGRDQALGDLRADLYRADSVEGLQNVVNDEVKARLSKAHSTIQRRLKEYSTKIREEAVSFNTAFEQRFRDLYEELKLIGKASHGSGSGSFTLSPAASEVSLNGGSALEGSTMGNITSGAIIGGVIGSFIPVIGTFIGAVLGGWIGSIIGPSLDERKETIWKELQPKIVEYFAGLRREANRLTEEFSDEVKSNIQNRIDTHVQHYRHDVDRMRQDQAREQGELEDLQDTLEKDLAELKTRRGRVRAQQAHLRQAIEAR